jgi:endonuclease/exonuclease/phosphatase family metal-dependent hydrolase
VDDASTADRIPVRSFLVATYNVHECVGTDGCRDVARVAQVIRELNADIIGLQEVDAQADGVHASGQVDYLVHATSFRAVTGLMVRRHTADFGNILLTRYPVLSVRHLDLSVPGREPRGAIDAEIEVDGVPIRVVVTHLGLKQFERRFQVRKLLDVLAVPLGHLTLVLGDINEWLPLSPVLHGLQVRLGRSPALRTFPSSFPVFALDRIWVQPRHALVSVRVHDTALSRVASDHLPVVASIDGGQVP